MGWKGLRTYKALVALNRKMVLPLFSTMKVCGQRAALGRGGSPLALVETGLGGSIGLNPRALAKGWGGKERGPEGGVRDGGAAYSEGHWTLTGSPWLGGGEVKFRRMSRVGGISFTFKLTIPTRRALLILAELLSQQRPGPS